MRGPIVTDGILLVEDDPEVAARITRALDGSGFAVHRVPTVDAALEALATRGAACVVLDADPADAASVEGVRRVQARHGGTPVVLLARDASVELAVRAIESGAFGIVGTDGEYDAAIVGKVREAIADAGSAGRRGRLVRPVFVGRDSERAFLERELAEASAGQGRVALVVGEDGVGRTSLVREVARIARERGALVLWAQCDAARDAPAYWPWTQALRSLASAAGADAARAEEALAALREAGAAGERPRFRCFDDVTDVLRRAAARHPLVCVLDDLHHADEGSLQIVGFLATQIGGARVLVVATYRETGLAGPARAELQRIADHPATSVVRLAGFDEAEVQRYVVAAAGVTPSPALVRAVVEKTAGIPLFVADVVGLLASDGRLDDESPAPTRIALSDARRQAIEDRLARASEGCRDVLAAAAVVAADLDLGHLARVADHEPAATRAAIDEAVAHGIAVVIEPSGAIRFANALVRDVLYERVAPPVRSRLHARAAEALEGLVPARSERALAAIARHRLESAATREDVARAFGYVVAAGHRAAELMAHDEAARCYEIALGVAERAELATPTMQLEVLIELAEARWRAGHTDAARDVGRRALAVARAAAEPAAVAAAALAFAGRLPGFGAIACDEEVVVELEQALAGLPPTATALRAMLMARLAEELTYLPRRTADRTLAPKAITLARSLDDPAVLASVLRTTQWSVWTPDDVERRRQLAEEIVELAARTHDPLLALDGELFRLWSALEHGEMDVARRQLALVARLAERLRLPYYAWMSTMARAALHFAAGRLDDVDVVAEEALRAYDPHANPTVSLFVGAQRGHVMWHRGRFDELTDWITDVIGGFSMLAATLECSLVITHAEAGQHELARVLLARFAADDFAGVPRNPMWLMNVLSLAEGCIALGDVDAAARLYQLLAPFARYNCVVIPVWVGAPVAHYMAGLAALLGDGAAARRHYEDALVLEARTGTRQWGARTQLGYARFLLASGRPADLERARQLVASARAIGEDLGLAPVLRLVDALATPTHAAPGRRCRFYRAGGAWEIELDGRRATVRHRVGMEYLCHLLERPGVPVSALELASAGGRVLVEAGGGPPLDRRALAEIQQRIGEIQSEMDGCLARGAVASEALRAELAECRAYLCGRGGGLVSAAARARPAVTKALDRAIDAIAAVHEGLGHHLRRHVETGRLCTYVPDPAAPMSFEFRRGPGAR